MRQAGQPLSTARVQAPEEPVPGTRRLSGLSWLRSLVAMHDRESAVKAGDTSRSARTFNVRPIASADTPAHVATGAPGANRPDVSFQAPGTSGMSRPSRVGLDAKSTSPAMRSPAYTISKSAVHHAALSTTR